MGLSACSANWSGSKSLEPVLQLCAWVGALSDVPEYQQRGISNDSWKIKNKVNRLAGKSWLLLEKDSGEGELRGLEVTIAPSSHDLTTSPRCEFTTPTMKVKKTVPASKKHGRRCIRKESSSPQTDRVVAESQSCPSVPGWWQQCTLYNVKPKIYLYLFVDQPFYFERIHVYETCVVGDPRKLTAIQTKSEYF